MIRPYANELPHAGDVMPLDDVMPLQTFCVRCTYIHWLKHMIIVSIRNASAETIEAFKVRIGGSYKMLPITFSTVLFYTFACATAQGHSRGA
eukprot:scaffold225075_cov18-Prasinocladus_malaysianus.AAC.1